MWMMKCLSELKVQWFVDSFGWVSLSRSLYLHFSLIYFLSPTFLGQ